MKVKLNDQVIEFIDDNLSFWKDQVAVLGFSEAQNLYFHLFNNCRIPRIVFKCFETNSKNQYKLTYYNLANENIVSIFEFSKGEFTVVDGEVSFHETNDLSDAIKEAEKFLTEEDYKILEL